LLCVTVLALLPVEMLSSPVFKWWDKAQHSLAFAVLGLLGFVAFPARLRQVAAGLVLYGVAIELAQLAVGWRFGALASGKTWWPMAPAWGWPGVSEVFGASGGALPSTFQQRFA
jgi:hypothetical protein